MIHSVIIEEPEMHIVRLTENMFSKYFVFLFAFLFASAAGYAQPSGGPYGPIDQRYEIPKVLHVYYVSPDAKADSPGTTLEQPTTLEAAIERVVTGDVIVMRGGIYRTGNLILNQGITLQPYADKRPILKGTKAATNWVALRPVANRLIREHRLCKREDTRQDIIWIDGFAYHHSSAVTWTQCYRHPLSHVFSHYLCLHL
jgi:hypothetical protein